MIKNIPRGGNIRIPFYTVLIILCIAILFSINALAYSGGTGTSADPFQIASIDDLYNIRYNLTSNFTLMNNLNFQNPNHYENATASLSENTTGDGWLPISIFEGMFNGNNYTIYNLFIDRNDTDNIGLFGYVSGYGILINIKLDNSSVSGSDNTGTLVGNGEDVYISNVHIINSNVYGNLSLLENGATGGLVGTLSSTEINNCSFQGNVSGELDVGGLIGYSDNELIETSYSLGNVSGVNWTGGFIGYFEGTTITNCYSQSNVSGTNIVGGFASVLDGTTSNSYSTGHVTGTDYVEGFATVIGTVTNCFYDNETSGHTGSPVNNASGINTSDMQTITTFAGASWDISERGDWDGEVWFILSGETYPQLGPVAGRIRLVGALFFDLEEMILDTYTPVMAILSVCLILGSILTIIGVFMKFRGLI